MIAILPLAPSINRTYKAGRGKFYLSDNAIAFKEECRIALRNATIRPDILREIREQKKKNIQTPLLLQLSFYLDSLWRSDIDGRIKITQDAIFDFIELNDNMVSTLVARKILDKKKPRTEAWLGIDTDCLS